MLRAIFSLLAVLALIVPAGAQQAERTVNFYNWSDYIDPTVLDGFTKETGIKVTIRKGSDTELANQIVQEGASSPADVFVTENSPAMVLVEKAGLFATLPKDVLDQVPAPR